MLREISIHEVHRDILLAELAHLVRYLRGLGHEGCEVLFGWHWGMNYYPTSSWVAEVMTLAEVESKVRQVEEAGLGRLGGDDLYLKVPGMDCEFCFCHHAGIHFTFPEPGPVTNAFLERWRSAGLCPEHAETGGTCVQRQ